MKDKRIQRAKGLDIFLWDDIYIYIYIQVKSLAPQKKFQQILNAILTKIKKNAITKFRRKW